MRGAEPPLPNTSSLCGSQLEQRGNFTLTFYTHPNILPYISHAVERVSLNNQETNFHEKYLI